MDYTQFLLMKEELSLIAVIVILFIADLFMSPDAHKQDGKPVLNTMLPVILVHPECRHPDCLPDGPSVDAPAGHQHQAG